MPLWQQKSNESPLLDTWVSAILAMDDTTKPKKDVRFGSKGNDSAASLDGKQGRKLLNVSSGSKPRIRRKKAKKSPQSTSGIRRMSGLEFLQKLQSKPRKLSTVRADSGRPFLPANFPFGLSPVPIQTPANFFTTDESLLSGTPIR